MSRINLRATPKTKLQNQTSSGSKSFASKIFVGLAAIIFVFSVFGATAPKALAHNQGPEDHTGDHQNCGDFEFNHEFEFDHDQTVDTETEDVDLDHSFDLFGHNGGNHDWSCDDQHPMHQPDPKLHFIKQICPSYGDIAGNEEADNYDDTDGHFTEFSNYDDGSFSPAPNQPVKPNEISENCAGAAGWEFMLSTDKNQEDDVAIVGPTDESGKFNISVSDLDSALADALFAGQQLWVSEVMQDSAAFGALRCYNDALNGDNLEFVRFNIEAMPKDIYCIAYNVAAEAEDSSSISGIKFNDLNNDGVMDAGEPVLSGWTFNLDAGADGTVDKSTATDADGIYSFDDLPSGTYRIREVQQPTWTQTTPNPADIIFVAGQDVYDVNFGNHQVIGGCTENCGGDNDNRFTLTVSTSGDGQGKVGSNDAFIFCTSAEAVDAPENPEGQHCTHTYSEGTAVTLTATADEGSTFSNTWTTGPCIGSHDPVCTFTMNANISANARFTLVTNGGGSTRGNGSRSGGLKPVPDVGGLPIPQILGDNTSELPRTGMPIMPVVASFVLAGLTTLVLRKKLVI